MKQVKTILFSARVTGGFAEALSTVVFVDGSTEQLAGEDAMAGLVTFAFGYGLPQLHDARDVARRVPELTNKPLPEWITP